jgi:hypothetical protein
MSGFDAEILALVEHAPHSEFLEDLTHRAQASHLKTGYGLPLSFVSQSELDSNHPYELFIARTGRVPTRDNLHDRYNALMWLTTPRTKARLNQLQAQAIEENRNSNIRGPLRDAATLWDENLAIILASDDEEKIRGLLRSQNWRAIFLEERECWLTNEAQGGRWPRWQVFVFGHALLEKLENPYKSITAHTLVLRVCERSWNSVDVALSAHLNAKLTTKRLTPLPLMGLPGWAEDNDRPEFYADERVFRKPKARG